MHPPVQLGKLRLGEVRGPLEVSQLVKGWDGNVQRSLGSREGRVPPKEGTAKAKTGGEREACPHPNSPLSSQQTTWKWLSNDRTTRSQKLGSPRPGVDGF